MPSLGEVLPVADKEVQRHVRGGEGGVL